MELVEGVALLVGVVYFEITEVRGWEDLQETLGFLVLLWRSCGECWKV
jgi:hypothetical protein